MSFHLQTNNLISSEDDAAAALQVSKALTSALLKYRFKATPNEEVSKVLNVWKGITCKECIFFLVAKNRKKDKFHI